MKGNKIACLLILAAIMVPASAVKIEDATISPQMANSQTDFTHTVFAEFSTATWCSYCKYAHAALKDIYAHGWYPFYYVSLVYDENVHASGRLDDLNTYYLPTVYFDGGYLVEVGGDPQTTEGYYNESIISCGARQVSDVDVSLSAMWMGNATMKIDVAVYNNEVLGYEGCLKVYVTEISSARGWLDTGDHPYTFAFLDYALNGDVQVGPKETWQETVIWNGNEHTDGHGGTFGNITADNIMIIAALSNAEWHQGYAVPPREQPFDAYYVDDTAAAIPGMDTSPPQATVEIPKEGYLYLMGKEIVPVGATVVIGAITARADANDAETGIGVVEFYVDDTLQSTVSSYPYEWLWDAPAFFKHTLKVVAKDFAGNTASDEREIWIFNI